MSRTILVTGATGYIGSHTCLALLEAGYQVIGIDNLSNSKEESLHRVQQITGKHLSFIQCDLLDKAGLDQVFDKHEPSAVIHFAGLKAVGESVEQPLLYYNNNLTGTINLLQAMVEAQVRNIVFSSSCTVYGAPEKLPIREDFPLEAVNPYGQTKLTIEYMLQDLYATAKPSSPSNTCSRICTLQTPSGTSPSCATSTRSAPTPAVTSVKTQWASPAT